ncbi:MAG: selenocysteine-specific translation elongation factor, partial [Acidimicrobiia bacterium]
ALTGRDPDRLAEEKERGLTIDLGFAWTTLPSGMSIGFVDVPGHERFIKNMLAGIDAVNVGLLVVAADEGWMPQSEEHLAILDLLEIPRLVIALTRTGLADEETREMAEAEIEEQVVGTVAEGAPVVRVDSISGEGIEQLGSELEKALMSVTVPDLGRPRLWVDRSFSIRGAGTVVTGTLLNGGLALGDEVAILPAGEVSRIRGIQSHEETRQQVEPGTRTALNLSGIDTAAAARGAMIGKAADWAPTSRFLSSLRTVRNLADPLRDRGAYHLHVGSGSWPARIRLLDSPELSGPGHAVITTSDPIPLTMADRFILREVGRRAVVAGGRVIEPAPPTRIRSVNVSHLDGLLGQTPDIQATGLLAGRGWAGANTLSAHSRGGVPSAAIQAGEVVVDPAEGERLTGLAIETVETYQTDNPLRPGMPKASLASTIGIDLDLLGVLVGMTDALVETGTDIATTGFTVNLDAAQEAAWQAARTRLQAGLAVPAVGELGMTTELVYALIRAGRLVKINNDLAYLPGQVDEMVAGLGELGDGFTVAEFRDHFGLTRKYAVPLLEWLDREGHTARRGDMRTLRAK